MARLDDRKAPVRAIRRYLGLLGPGLITGAADDDPSGITTYSVVGASFGYGLLWTAVASTPLMTAVQLVCARIGLVTGRGIIGAARATCPRWVLLGACGLLVVANGFNIGADLAGMAEVTEMLSGVPHGWLIPVFGLLILVTMLVTSYRQLAQQLKWLTLSLFAYVLAAVFARPDWGHVVVASLIPSIQWTPSYWSALVGTLGTTISPYLFFWQASQEVEEVQADSSGRYAAGVTPAVLREARIDVTSGMLFSNSVMFFIIVATGSTLHPAGVRNIETARQAAEALRPLAGDAAYVLYALGIIGTGLLAIPVLAGSASYALAELWGWRVGLDLPVRSAGQFYAALIGGVVVGIIVDLLGLSPVRALFWAAVVNGVLAAPLLALVMVVGSDRRVMGEHTIGRWLKGLGWLCVAVMTAAAVALVV